MPIATSIRAGCTHRLSHHGLRGCKGCATLAAVILGAVASAPAAQARIAVLPRPIGAVSGTVQARWTEIRRAGPRTTRTDAAITFTVSDRLRARGAAEAWVPQPQPDFVLDVFRRDYAHLLRARVAVDRFMRTVDDVCETGAPARAITLVTGLIQPHALLQTTQDPTLDLPRRTGATDLRPVDVFVRTGGEEREDVPATGIVATRTSGTDCTGFEPDGRSAPRAVDAHTQMHLGELAGPDVVESIIGAADMPLRVTRDQRLVMDEPQPLVFLGLNSQTDTLTGSWSPHLRLAGPPRAQRALCRLPGARRMRSVHTLRGARGLLRRYGFAHVAFVPPGGRTPTSFSLDAPSADAFCGVTLGTRRHPILRARG